MAGQVSSSRRRKSRSKPVPRNRLNLQKPNGVIAPRVKKVGGDKFAIVCIDPAKHRSEWMMADYYGNLLIEPRTVEHNRNCFDVAVESVRQAQAQHNIRDTIVVVERTGTYYLPPKRAFARAGFETRVVHPFATKQYRVPADPGNKTDETDLYAQHRAAVAGFGLREAELEPPYRALQFRARHRRSLVEKSSALACQIREHLHLAMPGYAALFTHLLIHQSAMAIARRCDSPAAVLQLGQIGLTRQLRENKVRVQARTIEKVLEWAAQASRDHIEDGPLHHAIWTDLDELYQHSRRKIVDQERELAHVLVGTPYIRLLAIPGINVVSAAELAGEMGPITNYVNANAITGRSGLYPSRHQSDQTDRNSGPIIRRANRRLRCALMRIADNLVGHCAYYRAKAEVDRSRAIAERAIRVKTASRFSRLAFVCVAGDQPMRHPCFRRPDSVLVKLRLFHHEHRTSVDLVLADLETTVAQLPGNTRRQEAEIVA
jgi:transposase